MILSPLSLLPLPLLLALATTDQETDDARKELLLKLIEKLQDRKKQLEVKDIQNTTPQPEDDEEVLEEDPTEYGEFYEGDMVIENTKARSRVLQTNYWPNGVIPYDFRRGFPSEDRQRVLEVMNYLNQNTCLQKTWHFLDKGTYVKISNSKPGCFATVGRPSSGKGKVNLSHSCMSKDGVIIHELLHSAGIFHEHSRYDRDQYVKIHWENIRPGDQHNFMMRNNFQVFNIPYDYYSIMHYNILAYTKNGKPTLEPKQQVDLRKLGQRDYLTPSDLEKIRRIYCH